MRVFCDLDGYGYPVLRTRIKVGFDCWWQLNRCVAPWVASEPKNMIKEILINTELVEKKGIIKIDGFVRA
jgi:hypothetical protein